MIYLIDNAWAWAPLVIALVLASASVAAALSAIKSAKPFKISRDYFFDGPGISNAGAISTLLAILPVLLSADVRADARSASLLGAASMLFAFATFLAFWLYATVNAKKPDLNGAIELKSRLPVTVQAVIISALIVGAGCFLVFVVVTPLLKPQPAPAESSKSNISVVECSHAAH